MGEDVAMRHGPIGVHGVVAQNDSKARRWLAEPLWPRAGPRAPSPVAAGLVDGSMGRGIGLASQISCMRAETARGGQVGLGESWPGREANIIQPGTLAMARATRSATAAKVIYTPRMQDDPAPGGVPRCGLPLADTDVPLAHAPPSPASTPRLDV